MADERSSTAAGYGRRVDPELAAALVRAASRGRRAERRPAIGGVTPRRAPRLSIEGLSRDALSAVRAAGYASPEGLADLSLADFGAAVTGVSLSDLDALHRARVAQAWAATAAGARVRKVVVPHRIMPGDLLGFLNACGGKIVWPDGGLRPVLPDDFLDAVGPLPDVEPEPWPFGDPRPPRPSPDPVPWHDLRGLTLRPDEARGAVDLLDGASLAAVEPDPGRARRLLAQPLGAGEIGDAVALSQALAAAGDTLLAARLAAHAAASARDAKLGAIERYQASVVAPAAALAGTPTGSVRALEATASAVLREAVPGTAAHRAAARAAVRARRASAGRRVRRAGGSRSAAAARASLAARADAVAALTGGALDDDVRAASTIGTHTAAMLVDTMRATAAAVMHGSRPGVVRNPRDAGVDGRMLPRDGARHLVGRGGLGTLGDPVVRAAVGATFANLRAANAAPLGDLLAATQGDLFRFDFLLGEARHLLDDVTGIERMLMDLLDMVVEVGTQAVEGVDELIGKLLDELTAKLAELALQLQGTLLGLATALRDQLGLLAVLEVLANWPWDNWVGVFEGTRSHLGDDDEPGLLDAVARAFDDLLAGEIDGVIDGIETELTAKLGELDGRLANLALVPDDVPAGEEVADATARLGTILADIDAQLAGLGVTAASGDLLDALRDALAEIDLVALADPVLSGLRSGSGVPGWLQALVAAYVATPFVAAIAVFMLPLMVASPGFVLPEPLRIAVAGGVTVGALTVFSPLLLGALLSALIAFALVGLAQAGISLFVRFVLMPALGTAANIGRQVERLLATLDAEFERLLGDVLDIGVLEGLLDAWASELALLEGVLPREAVELLHTVLTDARDLVAKRLEDLLCATERAFFRETLTLVATPAAGVAPPLGAAAIGGLVDPGLGASARYGAALSAFEHARVMSLDVPQVPLTHVLSVRQLLADPAATEPPASPPPRAFAELLTGDPVRFSITQSMVDRLLPGAYGVLVKDVQVHVDLDLEGAGFLDDAAAAVAIGPALAQAFAAAHPALAARDVTDLVDAGLAPGASLDDAGRASVLAAGATDLDGLDAAAASVLASVLVAGIDRAGIATSALAADPPLATVGTLVAGGLGTGDPVRLDALGVDAVATIAALIEAAQPSARHVTAEQVVAAALGALAAGPARPLSEVTVADVAVAGLVAALKVEDALGAVVDGARRIAGDGADPALDGRLPGGGFPGLAVSAGRVPTGLPIALTQLGPSRVRLRDADLADAYRDSCGSLLSPEDLPCALKHTRLVDDALNPAAAAEGWRLLELDDPAVSHVYSHFHVLRDGLRFVLPDKQLKPFEHRGLIGDWQLEVPALVNESVRQLLPPIRDVRLVVSTVARHDPALVPLVAQPQLLLPEVALPTLDSPADAAELIASVLDELGDRFQSAIDELRRQIDATLDDLTGKVAALGAGVQGLLGVSELLVAATTQLAALTGVFAPEQTIRMLVLDKAALANAAGFLAGSTAARTTTFTVAPDALAAQGIAGTVERCVAAVIAPVAASVLLEQPVWPTEDGSLRGPSGADYPLDLDRGSAFAAVDEPTPVGEWRITLPANSPALTDVGIGLLVALAD